MHKFEVKPRDPEKISTGANTEVWMDGKKLSGCTGFKFEVTAKGVAEITLTMLASVNILASTEEFKLV